MLGVFANHHDPTLTLDDFALFADFLNRRSDFHWLASNPSETDIRIPDKSIVSFSYKTILFSR